jgi:hypothetical protein
LFNEYSLFLELRLVFVFSSLIFVQILLYLCIKVYLDLWSMLVFIKRVVSKRFEWCWKREKSFHAKSGTKRSLFRLWLRLLHAMLDVVLVVCLVFFAVAWLVSNDWDCLMSLWKNHALFLLYRSIYWVFSLMLYLGWLGACLQLVMPLYASFNDILSLCMIMAVIALLVGRSQSFASLRFVLSISSTRASNSQKPSYSNVSIIHTY